MMMVMVEMMVVVHVLVVVHQLPMNEWGTSHIMLGRRKSAIP